jgi:hypothetical protein
MHAPSPLKPVSAASSGKPTLNYAPPLPIRERVGHYVPSREQVLNFLKNLVWVAPLTLLIWVYAEREQTVTVSPLTFPVEVLTTAPNRLVTLRKPADKNVVVELSGPRARLDRVRELLQPKPGAPAVVQIYVDPQLNPPGQELLTVNAINNNAVFKNHGITVKSAQPPYLYVGIDTYQEVDVPVKAPPDVQRQLSDQTYFTPGVVKLRAPTELIERATAAGELAVYADVSKREEFRTKTGPQKLDNVPVYWMLNKEVQREYVTVTPVAVTANLDIRRRDVTDEIGSVPVFKETPAGLEDRFRVEYITPSPIANVKVTGPDEQIGLIRNGTFKVKARIEVSSLDNTDRPNSKDLKFELPPGVTLHKDTPGKFEYRLVPKE